MGPLMGLRALEIGNGGEVAGKLLADAGVDVIRIEPLDGARTRHTGPFVADVPDVNNSIHYQYLNTSKRGITLNLDMEDGVRIWKLLVRTADIVIDSSGPTDLDYRNAGYEQFGDHERLVWCSVTPFGRSGPYSDWQTNDLVSLAMGGPPMSSGYDNHDLPPMRSDGEHSYAIVGEYAVSATMAAVLQRTSTGTGQFIDVSTHEAISATTEGAFANWEYLRSIVQRQTGRHASVNPTAPAQYRCSDGVYVLLLGGGIPRTRAAWTALLEWMDEHDAADDLHDTKYEEMIFSDPRLHSDERRHVAETVGNFAEQLDSEEVYKRAQSMHMSWGLVRRPEDNLDDPHWDDRSFFIDEEINGHPSKVRYPGAPYRFTNSPVRMRSRAPLLGEHTYEILRELEISEDEVKKLATASVI